MATTVYLSKRYLRSRKRNGQRQHRYSVRWFDGEWHCETTGTADATQAEDYRKQKWAELNIPGAAPEPIEEPKPAPSWKDCREALERAMLADKMRQSYIDDSLLMFDSVRKMFPEAASPADITPELANEYKRRRSEDARGLSAWTIRGDLSTLKAIFGKWLGKECNLLDTAANPFANVKAPRCDEPDVRIVSASESAGLLAWLNTRWNNWRLPIVYLEVASRVGWRATELASMKADDVLDDGFIRVAAESSKTRRQKHGWLPPALHAELKACAADGWAFGRFADELRRLLLIWKHQPHHAAKIKEFSPARLVGWIQDELRRFNDAKADEAKESDPPATWDSFTLHDFRRTAITALQMSGTSEKETSIMVGATPEVIRKHYEKMDQLGIARRAGERLAGQSQFSLRAGCAQAEMGAVDNATNSPQTVVA